MKLSRPLSKTVLGASILSIVVRWPCQGYMNKPELLCFHKPSAKRDWTGPHRLRLPTGNSARNLNHLSPRRHRLYPSALLPRTANNAVGSTSNDLEEKTTGQAILSLAVPALASLAIDPLMTLADTAFVGRYATSPNALAGMASASSLLIFSFYIFNFLCTATTPIVASRRSSGDEQGALTVGGQSLSLALLLGTALTGVLLTFSGPLLALMGTGSTGVEANDYATSFLAIRSFAAPAVLVSSAATGILRGYLDTKTPLVIIAGANIVNLVLDIILISGAGMGPTGAAIATTTAEWMCAISFLGVLSGKLPSADGELGSNPSDMDTKSNGICKETTLTVTPVLSIPPWEDVKPLIVASSSVFLRSIVLQTALSSAAALAARNESHGISGAAASAAAHQIALQLWLLCSFICDALAAASQALVADALGREDMEGTRSVSSTVLSYSIGLGVILSLALGIGTASNFLLDFFTTDPAIQAELVPLLNIIILAQPLNSFVFAADGVLQGASEFPYQAKCMALSVGVAMASFCGLEYLGYGQQDTLVNVWYGLVVLQFMRGVTSLWKMVEKEGPIDLMGKRPNEETPVGKF